MSQTVLNYQMAAGKYQRGAGQADAAAAQTDAPVAVPLAVQAGATIHTTLWA